MESPAFTVFKKHPGDSDAGGLRDTAVPMMKTPLVASYLPGLKLSPGSIRHIPTILPFDIDSFQSAHNDSIKTQFPLLPGPTRSPDLRQRWVWRCKIVDQLMFKSEPDFDAR